MKKRRSKSKRRKESLGIKWLVVAGIVFGLAGVTFILHPIPYVSSGAVGYRGSIPVTTVVNTDGAVIVGYLFLFVSAFSLYLAYQIKKD